MKDKIITKKENNRKRSQSHRDKLKENGIKGRDNSAYAEFTELTTYICVDCKKRIKHYYNWDEYLGRIYKFRGRFRCKHCFFLSGNRKENSSALMGDYRLYEDRKVNDIDYFGE